MESHVLTRVPLPTGVELNVAVAGKPTSPAIILLHGFPESHRTWRNQIDALAVDHLVLAPDMRGFGESSRPLGVENYTADRAVADVLALADHYGLGGFTLAGHDWGGATAWDTALAHSERVERLIIVNSPHPFLFQKSLFDDPAQRIASRYMSDFRDPDFERSIEDIGVAGFFDAFFRRYADGSQLADEKPLYVAQWSRPGALTSMLNWYRAADFILPAPGAAPPRPEFLGQAFPRLAVPTLVVWGMDDQALLPVQLDGLDTLVDDLTVVRLEGVGHFAPWEAPRAVTSAMREWLAGAGHESRP